MDDTQSDGRVLERGKGITRERRLALLSDERRRRVVSCLREASAPVSVADLARRIARRESDGSDPSPPDGVDAVHVSLYHCHVPKLADLDVVELDRERNTVAPAANFESVAALADSLEEVDDRESV